MTILRVMMSLVHVSPVCFFFYAQRRRTTLPAAPLVLLVKTGAAVPAVKAVRDGAGEREEGEGRTTTRR